MKTFVKSRLKACTQVMSLAVLLVLSACSDSNDSATKAASVDVADTGIKLEVYKSPTCGCCQDWVDHVEADGFKALVHHPSDLGAVKQQYGISSAYQSCHTAVSEQGYVFEGHIPSELVKRFLDNPPEDAKGLAVPGMPIGSPGMEMGDRFDEYSVVVLFNDGRSEHFAKVKGVEILDD